MFLILCHLSSINYSHSSSGEVLLKTCLLILTVPQYVDTNVLQSTTIRCFPRVLQTFPELSCGQWHQTARIIIWAVFQTQPWSENSTFLFQGIVLLFLATVLPVWRHSRPSFLEVLLRDLQLVHHSRCHPFRTKEPLYNLPLEPTWSVHHIGHTGFTTTNCLVIVCRRDVDEKTVVRSDVL